MITILVVILLLVALAMIGLILIQRSEGGALGIGGGGGLVSARGSANLLTRATAVLAAVFIALCLVLAILSGAGGPGERSVVDDTAPDTDEPAQDQAPSVPQVPEAAGELIILPGDESREDWAPESGAAVPDSPANEGAPAVPDAQ